MLRVAAFFMLAIMLTLIACTVVHVGSSRRMMPSCVIGCDVVIEGPEPAASAPNHIPGET
jgi:hypothetical protein